MQDAVPCFDFAVRQEGISMAEFGVIRRSSPHWRYKYADSEASAVVTGLSRAV